MRFGQGEDTFRYTEAEAAMIAKLAAVKVAADNGNRKARKQIAKVLKQLAALRRRARRGDTRAARQAQVLEESGILAPSQTFAMEGADDAALEQMVARVAWGTGDKVWMVSQRAVLLGTSIGLLTCLLISRFLDRRSA